MDLAEKVLEWDSEIFSSHPTPLKYNTIFEEITYKERNFFRNFTPTSGSENLGFWERLEEWVSNVDSNDKQKALFEFVPYINFISHDDMISLFTSALSGPITRWLIDLRCIKFDDDIDYKLNQLIYENTWYASLTDMNLGDFYRVNRIQGIRVRPDFNTIVKLGDDTKLENLMTEEGWEQIVLIEDFIGSGTQFEGILNDFPNFLENYPILFVPQIICSDGLSEIKKQLAKYPNWEIDPVLVIEKSDCLHPGKDLLNSTVQQKIVDIAKSKFVAQWSKIAMLDKDSMVYGFGHIGALLVLYTNTPDNTMPLIWKKVEGWNALFPRSSREG